jgi:hypothetical protein
MAMPIIAVPQYPDVPFADGVPPVLRNPLANPAQLVTQLLSGDVIGVLTDALRPVWGVFDSFGNPVAIADTVSVLEYRADSRLSSYPQEQGAFADVNKVQMPYASTVQLVCGRTASDRGMFLAAIEGAKQSTDLYSIVCPETTYQNANIVAYDLHRETRNGATLLKVNVHLEEVRITGGAQFQNTQNPASADPSNLGQVQPQTPTAGQSTLFGPLAVTTGPGGVL